MVQPSLFPVASVFQAMPVLLLLPVCPLPEKMGITPSRAQEVQAAPMAQSLSSLPFPTTLYQDQKSATKAQLSRDLQNPLCWWKHGILGLFRVTSDSPAF